MRTDYIKKRLHGEVFALRNKELSSLIDFVNNDALSAIDYKGADPKSVNYEVIENTAIISIDGAMAKKSYTGLCESVFGYNEIISMLQKAESDPNIEKVISVVDSPGGAVSGVAQLHDVISNISKPTITYYDNLGASAAIWGFIGSDKIYASPTTLIGSIGVMAIVSKETEEGTTVLTSAGAENKVCSSEDECMAKIQSRINGYENKFYEAIQSSREGFDPETIRSVFNNGDVIFADEAAWNGFIDGVMSIRELFNKEI